MKQLIQIIIPLDSKMPNGVANLTVEGTELVVKDVVDSLKEIYDIVNVLEEK